MEDQRPKPHGEQESGETPRQTTSGEYPGVLRRRRGREAGDGVTSM
jgi:hypothetical protein